MNPDTRHSSSARTTPAPERAALARIAVVVAACALVGCLGSTVEPLALQITVNAPATAAVGDTVRFATEMQGNDLVGVVAEYGDDSTDALALGFSRTARTTFSHVYTTAGTFTTTFTVFQADSAQKAATATIEVH
jgi:hypothetical protein